MLVIAHHFVNNPDSFWAAANKVMAESGVPKNLKLHAVFPSKDGKTGTCLWEADSPVEVQAWLDKTFSQYANNVTYEVNEAAAMGAPQKTMASAFA
ncbi:MAG TPA: hypothetical protein VM101_14265 [Flavitalea sp.]|nr:hypothetical protein [Flavitalea sp.]